MISNQTKALKALHQLLVHGRTKAYEGMSSGEFARFFDDLEYLPALMLEERNADEMFSAYLKEICIKFNCNHIFFQYCGGLMSQ